MRKESTCLLNNQGRLVDSFQTTTLKLYDCRHGQDQDMQSSYGCVHVWQHGCAILRCCVALLLHTHVLNYSWIFNQQCTEKHFQSDSYVVLLVSCTLYIRNSDGKTLPGMPLSISVHATSLLSVCSKKGKCMQSTQLQECLHYKMLLHYAVFLSFYNWMYIQCSHMQQQFFYKLVCIHICVLIFLVTSRLVEHGHFTADINYIV